MPKVKVLGVGIDDLSIDQATDLVLEWLTNSKDKHYIVTPNPEFLVTAHRDADFKATLNKADLAIPDGVGLKLAGIKNNVPGVDLMVNLAMIAAEKGYTIGLLGGQPGVAAKAAECLKKSYPSLKITTAQSGGEVNSSFDMTVKIPSTDILFVAFGAPKQERWINANLKKIPVKVAMGVGGAFDYISGVVPRAPQWVRSLGLEWFYRLLIQPWRIGRQLKLIKFIWLILVKKQSDNS